MQKHHTDQGGTKMAPQSTIETTRTTVTLNIIIAVSGPVQAARKGMTGPGYVWFLLGWWSYRWWEIDDPSVKKCSTAEIARAVESSYYIGVESALFGRDDAMTVAGIVRQEFVSLQLIMMRSKVARFALLSVGTSVVALAPHIYYINR